MGAHVDTHTQIIKNPGAVVQIIAEDVIFSQEEC